MKVKDTQLRRKILADKGTSETLRQAANEGCQNIELTIDGKKRTFEPRKTRKPL